MLPMYSRLKTNLIEHILTHYKNNNLVDGISIDFNLWEFIVKIMYCGSDIAGPCVMDELQTYPGGTIFESLSTEQKDQVWNTYKQIYLGEKRKIDQVFLDAYAIKHNFYNAYIGSETPEVPNYSGFLYYPTFMGYADGVISIPAFHIDAIDFVNDGDYPWFENDEVALFEEKVRRFEPVYGLT